MKSTTITTNGIDLHIVEEGSGPAVVLCHGFPETWRSWRRQIDMLAKAGFRAIAPDMRGCGGSSAPAESIAYSMIDIVGDLVGLLDSLNIADAAIVGHDWGAVAAWNASLLHPERFLRVAGMSVPYIPRGDVDLIGQLKGDHHHFYMEQYQVPTTNQFMMHDVKGTLQLAYWTGSGEAPGKDRFDPFASPLASLLPTKTHIPSFLDSEDIEHAVQTFSATGFEGGLNWYRGIGATFERMAAFEDAPTMQPSLFIVGEEDAIIRATGPWIEAMPKNAPGLTRLLKIPGAGHWVQQEAPDVVNTALLEFLR